MRQNNFNGQAEALPLERRRHKISWKNPRTQCQTAAGDVLKTFYY
jgi:hypothetical protein